MACAYLRQQRQAGALREDVLGTEVEDLAMDTVAGLFERDEHGRFPELRRYFTGGDLASKPLEEIEEDLRRLVMGAVTDRLFEAYQTADRSLSNLIRALKRVIQDRGDAHLQRRGKTLWIEIDSDVSKANTGQSPRHTSGQRMPMETLESRLTGAVEDGPSTGELLDVAIEALVSHPDYEAAYPLTRLAQVMRSARVRVQAVTEHEESVSMPDRPLLQKGELIPLIEQVLAEVREEKQSTYVGTGKVDEETYATYFEALHDRLEAEFVPPGDPEMTHYDALSAHMPDLPQEQYRARHRARFEYLYQLVREALVEHLQEVV